MQVKGQHHCVLCVFSPSQGACLSSAQQQGGTLSLIECTLFEDLDATDEDCEYLARSHQTQLLLSSCLIIGVVSPDNAAGQGFNHLEFKIVVEPPDGPSFSVVLLAPSRQEKAAWTSDISQVGPVRRC